MGSFPRAGAAYEDSVRLPAPELLEHLRDLLGAKPVAYLRGRDSAAVVQAWFQGMNPRLGDVAPARLLREGYLEQVGLGILAAARAFAGAG